MKPACINAVNAAAGRTLSDAEIRGIDERMTQTMTSLARSDPAAWRAMPMDQRVLMAAQTAMRDMQAQAARKIANAQRQVVATVSTQARIDELKGVVLGGNGRRGDAQIAEMVNTGNYIEGMKSETMSSLRELLHATSSREDVSAGRSALMFLFDAENPAMTRDLVREVFGNADGRTGNVMAQKAAKVWNETTEGLRQRFNAAGGDVGKLSYGYLSQAHDAIRVRAVTAQAWASKVMPLVDRARYVDDTGRQLNDAEVMAFLEKAHETIATEGLNKTEPGQITGSGARANRGGDARQVHFKDGDAYLEYMAEFGKGTAYDAMMGHIGMLTRDIGLVERYGPNPEAQFRLQTDISVRADGGMTRSFGNQQQAYWDMLSGKTSSPASELMASVGTGIRNIQTAGKLAGAVIQSITDIASMAVSTGFNKLSYWELFKNIKEQGSLTAAGKEAREFAITHAIIAESLAGGVNRWAGEVLSNGFTGRMANATMRLSLMNMWTDRMRNAFALTMMNGMGNMAKKTWAQLDEFDRQHMIRKGLNEADWEVINKAQLTMRDGRAYLTPEAIHATGHPASSQIVSRVLGLIKDESEFAVINPDMATRAVQTFGGLQSGTFAGEFARMVMQFKSFPAAMISRHWRRMLDSGYKLDGAPLIANPWAYGGALGLSTVILGAIAFQGKQLVAGKDPINMDPAEPTGRKFWAKAMAQGGGMSFMGDIMLADTIQDRSSLDTLGKMTMGPTFGSVADAFELTKGNIDEAMAGKNTHAGAESIRFARSHLPFVNLWYGKAALDHLFVHAMQENLSPGYLGRMQGKAQKDWGQESWWAPGDGLPERGPDFGAVMGDE